MGEILRRQPPHHRLISPSENKDDYPEASRWAQWLYLKQLQAAPPPDGIYPGLREAVRA